MNIVAFGEMAKQLAEAQRKAAEEGRRQGEIQASKLPRYEAVAHRSSQFARGSCGHDNLTR